MRNLKMQKWLVAAVVVLLSMCGCVQKSVEERSFVVQVRDKMTKEKIDAFYVVQVYVDSTWYYEFTEAGRPSYHSGEASISKINSGDIVRQKKRDTLKIPLILGYTTRDIEVGYCVIKDGYLPAFEGSTLGDVIELEPESSSRDISSQLDWWWKINVFTESTKVNEPHRKELLLLVDMQFNRLADRYGWDKSDSEAKTFRRLYDKYINEN